MQRPEFGNEYVRRDEEPEPITGLSSFAERDRMFRTHVSPTVCDMTFLEVRANRGSRPEQLKRHVSVVGAQRRQAWVVMSGDLQVFERGVGPA